MKWINKLRRDHRGSGIITVLVAVVFVMMLGTVLLFTSYTGLLVKVSERKSETSFYSAETAMDQIRAGVQQAVTNTISSAYSSVLVNYSKYVLEYNNDKPAGYATLDDYMEGKFRDTFAAMLSSWKYDAAGRLPLFNSGAAAGTYSVAGLRSFLAADLAPETVLNPDSTGAEKSVGVLKTDAAAHTITLKDITVHYTHNGYETNLSSDIRIALPPFSYTALEYSLSNLNRLSMVADGQLTQTAGGAITASGDIYAGSAVFSTNGNTLNYHDGTFVCRGDLAVSTGAAFSTAGAQQDTQLWAGGITVGAQGKATLAGSVNVADDLTLAGSGAAVTLGGTGTDDAYTGFGYLDDSANISGSTGIAGSDAAAANTSSAILVNGRGTTLNMAQLETLTLAGSGFVNAGGSGGYQNAQYIAMGQSVATRSDQLAYLAPVSCLPYPTNPYYNADNTDLTPDAAALTAIRDKIATLSAADDYRFYQYVDGVKAMYSSQTKLVYFFVTFNSTARANAFFAGYFGQNSDTVVNYLDSYLQSYSAAQVVFSRGDTYSADNGKLGLLTAGDTQMQKRTATYGTTFRRLYTKLSATASLSEAEINAGLTPYRYLVNTAAVDELPDGVTDFTEDGGETSETNPAKGRVVKGDYAVNAGETARLIICSGSVTVNADFSGTILAGGSVDLKAGISYSPEVSAVLQQAKNGTRRLVDYIAVGSGTGGKGSTSGSTSAWSVDELVTYQNWKKF